MVEMRDGVGMRDGVATMEVCAASLPAPLPPCPPASLPPASLPPAAHARTHCRGTRTTHAAHASSLATGWGGDDGGWD